MKFPQFLKIAVVEKPSIIYINKTVDGEYRIVGGPEGKLIEMFAQALKFSYKLLPAPDGEWGNLKDGKWSGGIGMVYRNEADIAISKFGVSALRSKYIVFSYPYSLEDLTFATRKPGLRSPIDALVHPFTYELWIAATLMIIVMSILFSLFHRLNFTKSLQQVFGILISQSVKTKNKRLKDRLIVSAWIWGALFLSYSYVAVLLSFLTVPLMEKGAEDVDALSAAVVAGTYKAMTYKGSMQLADLMDSKRKSVRIIADHIQVNNHLIEPNRKLITDALRKERIALISPRNTLIFFVQNEFFLSKDTFKSHPSSIVLSKTFCCKNQVDSFVHTLFASGLYQKDVDDDIFMTGLKAKSLENADPSEFENKAKSLSITDMSGAFILITMGCTLALIVFIAEILHFNFYAKQRIKVK